MFLGFDRSVLKVPTGNADECLSIVRTAEFLMGVLLSYE